VFQQEQANEGYPWHIMLKKSHSIMLCSYVGLLGYIDILMCHGINGFNMVCHGSQAILICADKLTFLFENSIAS